MIRNVNDLSAFRRWEKLIWDFDFKKKDDLDGRTISKNNNLEKDQIVLKSLPPKEKIHRL